MTVSPEFLLERATVNAREQAKRLETFIVENEHKVENTLTAFYSNPNEARTAYLILAQLLVAQGEDTPPIETPPLP